MSSLNMRTVRASEVKYPEIRFEITNAKDKATVILDFLESLSVQLDATLLIITSQSIKPMFERLNITYSAAGPSIVKKAAQPTKGNSISSVITMYGVGYLIVFNKSPSSGIFKKSPKTYTMSGNSKSFGKLVNVMIKTKTNESIVIFTEDGYEEGYAPEYETQKQEDPQNTYDKEEKPPFA